MAQIAQKFDFDAGMIKVKLVNHKLRTSLKPIKVNGINWVRKLPRNLQVNCLLP